MEQLLKTEIIRFAEEISKLPAGLVRCTSTNNAYRDWLYDVVKTTTLTYYHFDKPEVRYVVKFLKLYNKNLSLNTNITEDKVSKDIARAKERYLRGEKVHLNYKTIEAIGDYETSYKIRYFPYGQSAEGHALLVMIEGRTLGYNSNGVYNYIDEGDDEDDIDEDYFFDFDDDF